MAGLKPKFCFNLDMDPIRNRSIINYSNPSIARFHFVYKGLWESIVQRPYMGPRGRQPKSGLRHSDGHPLISRDHPNSGHWAVSTGRPKTALYFVTALQLAHQKVACKRVVVGHHTSLIVKRLSTSHAFFQRQLSPAGFTHGQVRPGPAR